MVYYWAASQMRHNNASWVIGAANPRLENNRYIDNNNSEMFAAYNNNNNKNEQQTGKLKKDTFTIPSVYMVEKWDQENNVRC